MPQFTLLIKVLDIGGREKKKKQLLTPRDDLKTFSSKREEKKLLEIVALCSVRGKWQEKYSEHGGKREKL